MCRRYAHVLIQKEQGRDGRVKDLMEENDIPSLIVFSRKVLRGTDFLLKKKQLLLYMLWFNFILGSNFIFLCFKLMHYHTQKLKSQNIFL